MTLKRVRLLAAIAALGMLVSSPALGDAANGERIYRGICLGCHGPFGVGGDAIRRAAGSPAALRTAISRVPQMSFLGTALTSQDIDDAAEYLGILFGVVPPVVVAPAVEYYHAALDHYFVSAAPEEIGTLDAGSTIRGWLRTGAIFNVWTGTTSAPAGATPVCRFYIPPVNGDSHFYSASPAECEEVRTRFPQFSYESSEVMAVRLPDLVTGACPAGTIAVYRLWNARADSNHRYTTSRDVRAQMIARGYASEGYGPDGVAFCAPA